MSHYDEQLEAEDAAKRSAFEAQRDHFLNRAINEATPISIRDLLAGLVAAVERMADAVETLAAARPELAISGDHGDAPITFSPQTLERLYSEAPSAPASSPPSTTNKAFVETFARAFDDARARALIKAIESISWFGCTHRLDMASQDLVVSVTRESYRFDQLAKMLDMQPVELELRLQEFDGFTKQPGHYSIRFPADWVRAA